MPFLPSLVIPQFTRQFDSCHHSCAQPILMLCFKHFPKLFPFPFHCCFSDHSIKTQKSQQHPQSVRSCDCCLLIEIPTETGKYPLTGDRDSGPSTVAIWGRKHDTEQETELKILPDSSGESSATFHSLSKKAHWGTLNEYWFFHVTQPAWKFGNNHHTLRWCQTVSESTLCL